MRKIKYYAVKVGRETGIFDSWDKCKQQINGYSGALYKSFETLEEAKLYIQPPLPPESRPKSEAVAYTDGSYDPDTNNCAYGVVILHNGKEEHFIQCFYDEAMNNVFAELKAAEFAMTYCVQNNIPSLDLYYDYTGIEKWCTGDWKANKPGTKDFKLFYDSIAPQLTVNFYKVIAHSGDHYNELADQLAKQALYE